jgi:transketolase
MVFEQIQDIEKLHQIANEIRIDCIRMLAKAESGHPGGSLSATDLVTALLFGVMNHNPKEPRWDGRDRFVMSKGHCVPAWYAAQAIAGYYDKEGYMSLREYGSRFQGHPDCNMMPELETASGSLGQGMSVACGMALAAKVDNKPHHIYCMIGDGESQEGQIWEAAMSAPKFKLDNLTVLLDNNNGQIDGYVDEVMSLDPIADKWKAFNWHVIEIDGHDMGQILRALKEAKETKGKPTFISAKTVKGKGVSFMENNIGWHGKTPNPEETQKALAELSA